MFAIHLQAGAQSSDPLLDLLVKKGYVTQEESQQLKSELQARQTNNPSVSSSKWKISDAIKSVELYGDLRFRYEDRGVHTPDEDRLEMGRYRYALRLGLRGEAADNFYYGLRLETAANPRSPWATFGTSTIVNAPAGNPYQGPFGKSTATLSLGQVYVGWRPADWVDIEVGKMPNPLYQTSMLWDSDISPEGAVERFKYTVGPADFFATFGQFVYEDLNPNDTVPNLVPTIPFGRKAETPFLLAWQGGFTFNFTTNISFKAAGTLYNYTGRGGGLWRPIWAVDILISLSANPPSRPTALSKAPAASPMA